VRRAVRLDAVFACGQRTHVRYAEGYSPGKVAAEFDVAIAGGGIGALTAGVHSARMGRSTLLLGGSAPGGLLLSIERIDGVPGFPEGVAGYELCPMLQEQAADEGAEIRMAQIEGLEPVGEGWRLATSDGDVEARAVILATGARLKTLGVEGEERLLGRGVSHCASCDAPLMRDRTVAVVGGGDSALQEALTLADAVGEVIVVHRGDALTAQAAYREPALAHPKISFRYATVVEEILGDDAVSGVRVRDVASGDVSELELAGVFVYVGLAPNSEFLRDRLDLDEDGRVPTDAAMQTELTGVFAAGIVRRGSLGQAAISAGEGAAAAKAAHGRLDHASHGEQQSTPAATAARGNGGSHG
jgi:thioredoxin reductase (NADPH)